LVAFPGGLPHRLVEFYNPEVGEKTEVACEYQVELPAAGWITLCRYDSCHGKFHRHRPHYPQGTSKRVGKRDVDYPGVPMKKRVHQALADVEKHAREWQRLIPKEVIERENAS
jgi:hypothetical protein